MSEMSDNTMARIFESHADATVRESHESVERMIDKLGLFDMLSIMAQVCEAKSEHIATNWQDEALAGAWLRASLKIEKVRDTQVIRSL